MALTAKEATYNTAVIAAAAAWDDLVDGRTVADAADNGSILLLPCRDQQGLASTVMETATLMATTATQRIRVRVPIKVATSDANINYMIKDPGIADILGGCPMFWYVTNRAGAVAGA